MKIPDAKVAVDKEWKKLETNPAWNLEKSTAETRLSAKHKETTRKSTLPHWWTFVISKNAELEPEVQKYKSQSRALVWHGKGRLWSPRSLHWTRLVCVPDYCCQNNERYCKITRLRRTSSWVQYPLTVLLERNLYGHPSAGLLWERQFEEVLLELGWEKNSELGMSRKQGLRRASGCVGCCVVKKEMLRPWRYEKRYLLSCKNYSAGDCLHCGFN